MVSKYAMKIPTKTVRDLVTYEKFNIARNLFVDMIQQNGSLN
jgi:hypothetical protein